MTEGESGVRRWLVDISRWRPSPAQFDAAAALLPRHERPAISRFVKEDDRKRALVSRLLQYSLVHHLLRIPFHLINIRRTTEGKPYLQNNSSGFPNFNFSTSHHGDYVGIASEPLCLVGLDIVSVSEPHGETAAEFVSNFSSCLTDHEWSCIVRAGTPRDVLTEFYRYTFLHREFIGRQHMHWQNQHFSHGILLCICWELKHLSADPGNPLCKSITTKYRTIPKISSELAEMKYS